VQDFDGDSIKNGQATYIAPLQPSTLATFRSWGSSTGAGRIRLAQGAKLGSFSMNTNARMNDYKRAVSQKQTLMESLIRLSGKDYQTSTTIKSRQTKLPDGSSIYRRGTQKSFDDINRNKTCWIGW